MLVVDNYYIWFIVVFNVNDVWFVVLYIDYVRLIVLNDHDIRFIVFDIDNMSDFDTSGLVFFLTLPGPEDMMKAFDYMLETAQAVARNLEGDVLDESRCVLTKQTLEHCRQQIRDLERRMLASTR